MSSGGGVERVLEKGSKTNSGVFNLASLSSRCLVSEVESDTSPLKTDDKYYGCLKLKCSYFLTPAAKHTFVRPSSFFSFTEEKPFIV